MVKMRASGVIGALLLAAGTAAAGAAEVAVRVFERTTGQPLAGTAVCLGTAADPGQFARARTGSGGQVRVDAVPAAPLMVTVSRPGYRGERRRLPPSVSDRQVALSLVAGGGGPRCGAPAESLGGEAPGNPLRLHGLGAGVLERDEQEWLLALEPRFSGKPTEYRVGWSADLSEYPWRPFESPLQASLPAPARGAPRVYLQLRRHVAASGADLERRTPVVGAPLR